MFEDMSLGMSAEKLSSARHRRKHPTPSEKRMHRFLRETALHETFQREVPMYGYCADFFCQRLKLVIEVDGPYHEDPQQAAADASRDRHLAARGLLTLRFSNDRLIQEPHSVRGAILGAIAKRARSLGLAEKVIRPKRPHGRREQVAQAQIGATIRLDCNCLGVRVKKAARRKPVVVAIQSACFRHRPGAIEVQRFTPCVTVAKAPAPKARKREPRVPWTEALRKKSAVGSPKRKRGPPRAEAPGVQARLDALRRGGIEALIEATQPKRLEDPGAKVLREWIEAGRPQILVNLDLPRAMKSDRSGS